MNALASIAAAAALPSALADRDALTRAAEIVALVVEARTSYPILANVRLRGDGRTLFLTATDLDINIDVAVAAAADIGLDFTIPAKLLKDVLKGAPKSADMVSLTMPPVTVTSVPTGKDVIDPETDEPATDPDTGETIPEMRDVLKCDGPMVVDFAAVKYSVKGLPSDTYPTMKGPVAETCDSLGVVSAVPSYRSFTMPGADLFAGLDCVQFAISNEESRYYLNGVYMHASGDGSIRFVATDGHRLARQDVSCPSGAADMAGVIIPKKTVALLVKLLRPAKGKDFPIVDIEVTDKHVRFMFDGITVTSKVIDGTFPDYERVTPKDNEKLATFGIAALVEAMKAVSLIASDSGGKAVKLSMESGICTLSATSPDNGTAESAFPIAQGFEGPFEIGFNARYLADMANEMKAAGEDITLAFNDPGAPALVKGGRDGWIGVLMPMRV